MRAELPEAQRGLDPSEQGHHIQMFDSAPAGGHTARGPGSPAQRMGQREESQDMGNECILISQLCLGSGSLLLLEKKCLNSQVPGTMHGLPPGRKGQESLRYWALRAGPGPLFPTVEPSLGFAQAGCGLSDYVNRRSRCGSREVAAHLGRVSQVVVRIKRHSAPGTVIKHELTTVLERL